MKYLNSLQDKNGNNVWTEGNDGIGSGLDADKLGGQDGSYYLNYNNTTSKPNISDISKNTLTSNITSANYFAFAQTPINTAEYSGVFKITATSTVDATIGHVMYVYVEGHLNGTPIFQVMSKTNNSTASTTGIYYLRGVYPKTANNGYPSSIEFYTYNATSRDIKIELIESNNLSLLSSITASTYNSTYQNITTTAVLYNGIITNGTIYGTLSGNATSSNYLYNASFVAGESLVANDIIYLNSDNKWYKVSIASRSIPLGAIFGRCSTTYALGATVSVYTYGYHALQTGLTGTINAYKDLFVRGSVSGNIFTTDGTLTTELEANYSYLRLGSVINSTSYLQYDGNNRVYTMTSNGISKIDGNNIDTSALQQIVSTTQPSDHVVGRVWVQTL